MNHYTIYSDAELFTAIQNSDESAFEELYNRYWFSLLRHAVKMLPTTVYAEEVVQDLFIRIWQTRETLQIENISKYLHTGVRHGCITLHRILLNKKKYWDHYKLSIPPHEDSVETDFISAEKYVELEKMISGLPSISQKIVRMKVMDALTLHDISRRLNCSKKTVEYHLTKSLKILKSGFQQLMMLIAFIFFR